MILYYTILLHRFDVLAQQVTDELPEVEAPDGTVARGQGCLVGFHTALAELAALFGMADQRFDTRPAIHKAGISRRSPLGQCAGIESRLLQAEFLQPSQRSQVLAIGIAVIAFVHPRRGQDACTKKVLMCFDHRADGGFVFHSDRCTGPNYEEIPPNPTKLKGAPKLEPVCSLALVEAAHGLDVEGQRLLWHHHPTTQEARHMEEEIGAIRIDLV